MERSVTEMLDRRKARAKGAETEATRLRDRANSLLSYEPFVDWSGELMESVGFFGEGRELTPYQQGKRGGIVEAIERVAELADNGDAFIARVFKERIVRHEKRK